MINYVTGDATQPQGPGPRIIAHIVNDEGKWGAGFVLALSKRDVYPEECYREWHQDRVWHDPDLGEQPFELGQTQVVALDDYPIFAANMLAQRGVRRDRNAPRAVDYNALGMCLQQLARFARINLPYIASVHMPRIGCDLGGGTWDEVEPLIQQNLIAHQVPVTVYDLP